MNNIKTYNVSAGFRRTYAKVYDVTCKDRSEIEMGRKQVTRVLLYDAVIVSLSTERDEAMDFMIRK
jgi:hypothetical protein